MAEGLLPRAPRGHPLVLPVLPFKFLLMGFQALWLCQHKARGGPWSPAAGGHSKLLIFISLA